MIARKRIAKSLRKSHLEVVELVAARVEDAWVLPRALPLALDLLEEAGAAVLNEEEEGGTKEERLLPPRRFVVEAKSKVTEFVAMGGLLATLDLEGNVRKKSYSCSHVKKIICVLCVLCKIQI